MAAQCLYIFPSSTVIKQTVTLGTVVAQSLKDHYTFPFLLSPSFLVAVTKAVDQAIYRLAGTLVSQNQFNRIVNESVGLRPGMNSEERCWGIIRMPLQKLLEKSAERATELVPVHSMGLQGKDPE